MVLSPDGQRVAVGDAQGLVSVWLIEKDQLIDRIHAHSSLVNSVAFNHDGSRLVTCSSDGMRMWNTNERDNSVQFADLPINTVSDLDFTHDGRRLVSSDWSGAIRVWDTGSCQPTWTARDSPIKIIWSIDLAPDDRTLAVAAVKWPWMEAAELTLWNIDTAQQMAVLDDTPRRYYDVAFSPNGERLACGCQAGVEIWDWRTRRIERVLRIPDATDYRGVEWSPDGKQLATCTLYPGKVVRWHTDDLARGPEILASNLQLPVDVAFSPDGRWLASSSLDRRILVWQLTDGQAHLAHTIDSPVNHVWDVDFSPDSRRLVSTGAGRVSVWNIETAALLMSFRGYSSQVYRARFSPDGNTLVTGGEPYRFALRFYRASGGR
jgi:WD40 repeat protein